MSLDFTLNYKDGRARTKDQKHRLGVVVRGLDGGYWSYVQFAEDVGYGDVVRDSVSADLIANSGVGTLTADAGVGTYQLKDTGEFAADDDKLLVGAIGYIHSGDGAGTAFYIKRHVDDDTLEIRALASPTGLVSGGWPVALDGTDSTPANRSLYNLVLPGLVRKGTVAGITRGVAQSSAKKDEYGWVKQTRWGVLKMDVSGRDLVVGEGVIPAAGALAQGFNAVASSPSQANVQNARLDIDRRIARNLFANIAGTTDLTAYLDLRIDNKVISYRYSDDEHALNAVVVQ